MLYEVITQVVLSLRIVSNLFIIFKIVFMKKSQLGIFHQRYYYQFFCKVKILCVVVLALLNFSVVSCDDSGSSENQSYDPDLASEIQSFMPDSGGIRTKFRNNFV